MKTHIVWGHWSLSAKEKYVVLRLGLAQPDVETPETLRERSRRPSGRGPGDPPGEVPETLRERSRRPSGRDPGDPPGEVPEGLWGSFL